MAKMLSIEIGYSTTTIVVMDYQAKKPKVYKCVEMETPRDAVADGYLNPQRMEILKDALKATLKKNKIRIKRVLFTIFSGKIITREIMLPGVKVHQINAIIESNVTEYFPIELSDYKITHMHISTFREGENVGKHKVLVIAAEKTLLEGYEKLAEALGLNIVDIDYAGNSVYQAVKQSAGAEAVMAIRVEDENALITIVKQGTIVMQRTVNYNIGRQQGTPIDPSDATQVLMGTVMRVIDFYVSNNEDGKIEQIYVTGSGSTDAEFIDGLAEQTMLPCRVLDNVRGVVIGRKADDAQISIFASAIGAGIRSVGFDSEKEKERRETNYVSASILIILLFVTMVAAIGLFSLIPYNTALIEQNALTRKQEQLAPAKAVYDQYNGMVDLMARVLYGNALTLNSNDSVLDFLTELEQKMPADVEFTEFSSDAEKCVISMRVADKETAAGVIKTFREFDSLASVTVESIIEEQPEEGEEGMVVLGHEGTTTYFTLTAVYRVNTLEDPAVVQEASAAQDTAEAVE